MTTDMDEMLNKVVKEEKARDKAQETRRELVAYLSVEIQDVIGQWASSKSNKYRPYAREAFLNIARKVSAPAGHGSQADNPSDKLLYAMNLKVRQPAPAPRKQEKNPLTKMARRK